MFEALRIPTGETREVAAAAVNPPFLRELERQRATWTHAPLTELQAMRRERQGQAIQAADVLRRAGVIR